MNPQPSRFCVKTIVTLKVFPSVYQKLQTHFVAELRVLLYFYYMLLSCRKIFFSISFFCICILNAQNYKPFDLKNIEWELYNSYIVNNGGQQNLYSYYIYYKVCNDTVFFENGVLKPQRYRTVYQRYLGHVTPPLTFTSSGTNTGFYLYGYLRQDSVMKRTYLRKPGETKDSLIMDYNLNVGDTIKRGHYKNNAFNQLLIVKKIANVIHAGTPVKAFYTDTLSDSYYFIEGLGHPYGVFGNNGSEVYFAAIENICWLTGIKSSTNCDLTIGINEIKTEKSSIQIFPNPNKGIFEIKTEKEFDEIEVLDIFGRVIFSEKNISSNNYLFKQNSLCEGSYFLKIKFSDNSVRVKKIIGVN